MDIKSRYISPTRTKEDQVKNSILLLDRVWMLWGRGHPYGPDLSAGSILDIQFAAGSVRMHIPANEIGRWQSVTHYRVRHHAVPGTPLEVTRSEACLRGYVMQRTLPDFILPGSLLLLYSDGATPRVVQPNDPDYVLARLIASYWLREDGRWCLNYPRPLLLPANSLEVKSCT